MEKSDLKLYICVLDDFPDYMVPTLVAHSVLGSHMKFYAPTPYHENHLKYFQYSVWLKESFKKCVVRVNQKEFDRIKNLENIFIGHENNTFGGKDSCIVLLPREEYPNVIKYAKLWAPKDIMDI